MKRLAVKGLCAGLVAGAALVLAVPSVAADLHRDRASVVVRERGPHIVRFHRFAAGNFSRLTIVERERWRHGSWFHGAHHGRFGWWWFAGGLWYWYPEPVYPYPTYISTEASYDYAPQGYSEDSWYYCDDPQGYYPYVRSCNVQWRPVPITPNARAEATYGEPPDAGGNEDEETSDQDQDEDNDRDRGSSGY